MASDTVTLLEVLAIAGLGVIAGLFLAYIMWATVTRTGERVRRRKCFWCGRQYNH